ARGYYQWSALLRALSAFEGYTELYRASPNARNIAELLLLREDVPRSLLSCIEELSEILSGLPGVNGRPAQRLAAELEARVRYTGIDEVLEQGLHTWITDYILLVRQLANAIHSSYLEAA
ncbi:alpha-E domain-containing protein, partial [Pseudomonas aeruginosa]